MEEKSNERKIKRPYKVYADIESILVPQDKKRNIQMNFITKRAKNKNMMLAVMAINQYVLMINLVNLVNHTQVKIMFAVLIII